MQLPDRKGGAAGQNSQAGIDREANAPFFIVGAGRSGTTLLRLILLGHSRLHIPPESWFLEDLVRELPLTGLLTDDQVSRAIDLVTGHHRWQDFHSDPDRFREQAQRLAMPTLRRFVDLIYFNELEPTGKSRFGDKSPTYFRILPEILALYPDARFIHLIRDGRDVAISCIDANWTRYYERNKFLWLEAMAFRERHRLSAYSGRILEVRYEDLVTNPGGTVHTICDFLGEPFEQEMLQWHRRVDTAIPERELSVHRRIKQKIDDQNIAVWNGRLSSFECFSMEACLSGPLQRLGYGLRYSGGGWRILLRPWGAFLSAAAPVLRRVLPALQRRRLLPNEIYF